MMRVLRFIAFAIAFAGFVDPSISVSSASRARIAVVAQASAAAGEVRARLIRDLSSSYELVPEVTTDTAAAVIIGDRYPEAMGRDPRVRPSDALLVSTVTLPLAAGSGVRIVRVDAPREIPAATAIHLDVEVEGTNVTRTTTDVTVTIAGLETGRVSHRWAANVERWRASLDAVPVGEPPYVIQVRLKPETTDAGASPPVASGFSRTAADVIVDARRAPLRVEFFDPRPSWATTFVRRALEADARFQVAALSFTSRAVSAQTGGAVPLTDSRLDAFDVVIVGGFDRLSAGDAHALDRFMRERGGAVVMLPDQRIDPGPARDLLSAPDLVERLLEQSAKLAVPPPAAPLQASELLLFRALMPGADVLARVPGTSRASDGAEPSAVIASAPRGAGRLLFSGAMDAWRFRAADNGAFDRFWQSTVAGLALAVPPPIAIEVEPPLLRPGEQGDVIVHLRPVDLAVSAMLDGDQPIRLRPEPEAGVYRGRFTVKATAGRSTVAVRATGAQSPLAARTILVRSDVERVRPAAGPSLSMLAASHRGIDVPPDRLADLERFVRNAVTSPRTPIVRHPMRSVWWIVPFVACLSAEWWLRRRLGLR
jgi:hypothetical protein